MVKLTNVDLSAYFMPNDAIQGESDYLGIFHNSKGNIQDVYGENWKGMIADQIVADANGIPQDINVDEIQSRGPSDKECLAQLVAAFQSTKTGSCVTIVAAPTGHIWHYKSLVALASDGGEHWCVTGSTNATDVAFQEGNSLVIFRSDIYAAAMIAQHNAIKALCRQKHPEWQLMALPAAAAVQSA